MGFMQTITLVGLLGVGAVYGGDGSSNAVSSNAFSNWIKSQPPDAQDMINRIQAAKKLPVPLPPTTPYDSNATAREEYLREYQNGYRCSLALVDMDYEAVKGVYQSAQCDGFYAGKATGRKDHPEKAAAMMGVPLDVYLQSQKTNSNSSDDSIKIRVTTNSIQLNGTEIRTGSKVGENRFISLKAVEQVLGQPQEIHLARVTAFVWINVGINVQRGFRGSEKGKIFKFQLFFEEFYDKRDGVQWGRFTGHINLDGVTLKSDSTLDSIGDDLKKAGFTIFEKTQPKTAKKGSVTIYA